MKKDKLIFVKVTRNLRNSTKIKSMDISREVLFDRMYDKPLSIYSRFVETII